MDFPSPELSQQLSELGIQVPGDLRRCAGTVRRLARGLPVTDTVWIDALVTLRILTPFQARWLEEGRGMDLIQGGNYVLQTPQCVHPVLQVTEVRKRGFSSPLLLSCLRTDQADSQEALARLTQIQTHLAHCRDKIPGLPIDSFESRNQLCQVSPFRPGEALSRLLVRRGRLTESHVRNLAIELVRQLQTAEPYALHGEIRLENLWLTRRGELILLNWGLLNARSPVLTIHTPIHDDVTDTLAPERIESSQPVTVASEIYAAGCVLWQLLSGRPPFLLADPLARMIAHRTRTIPDVRTVAPETSESLATLIRGMTTRDPHRRIQSFAEVQKELGGATGTRKQLQKFSRSFDSVAPLRTTYGPRQRSSKVPQMAAGLLITLTLSGIAWNRDHIGLPGLSRVKATVAPESLPLEARSNEVQDPVKTASLSEVETAEAPTQQILPLPDVVDGKLVLAAGTRYRAGTKTFPDELLVTSDQDRPATIELGGTPLILAAKSLRIEHVRFVGMQLDSPAPPIQLQSETLAITHTFARLQGASHPVPLISWTPTEGRQAGRLLIRNSEFLTNHDVIQVNGPISAVLLENSQVEQAQTLFRLTQGARSGLRVPVILNACTLRECGPLVALPADHRLRGTGLVSIQGADSLIDLRLGEGLIELQGGELETTWDEHLEIASQGLVTPQELVLVIHRNEVSQQIDEVDAEKLSIGGLISGRYQFIPSSNGFHQRDNLQVDALPVRFSPRDPGADPTRLPPRELP